MIKIKRKARYTKNNMEKLASHIVENMDLETLIIYARNKIVDNYERYRGDFFEDWENEFGES